MTDTVYPGPTITGHSYALQSLPPNAQIVDHQRHAVPLLDGMQEDDGQISCICGYSDDDGTTVECDQCKRWQHQICYYPKYEDRALPDDLQHYCVECKPQQDIDHMGARVRQRVKREEQALEINGTKRQAPKSHKKKIKEPGYTNGWPLDKSRHDRNSASPRDQPPPAKRPKTSHRPSESVGTTASTKGHSRKRNVSNVNNRRSLSRSPDTPTGGSLYSSDFMRCYREDNWDITHVNLYSSLDVSNALSEWLSAPEDTFREIHGTEKTDVLMRWDGDLNDIPGKAQIELTEVHDERVRDERGLFPAWKIVTVKDSVAQGAYIGEIKGHVGFKSEYQTETANRWNALRHPEPFVFFHPRLPVYIDARNEGTELRYIRRSCVPNAKLQILVTDSTNYRFCFMATEQIDPGREVAVAWDTWDGLPELRRQTLSDGDMDTMVSWVSNVLAGCGPCACQLPHNECRMARFDRRVVEGYPAEEEAQSAKLPKAKKKNKSVHHISPLNTHLNSRSGSEARKADLDDEQMDSRSTSGSTGRDSPSRDNTPHTHHFHNGSRSILPELSERERKKLAKEEEMFRRQEEQSSGKQGKKKRSSGGSNLNTPSATSSKQLGFPGSSKYADASTAKQIGLPSVKPGRRPKSSSTPKSTTTPIIRTVQRPQVDYVDSQVQCDLEEEEEAQKRSIPSPPHRPFLSSTRRLLQRCALNNARRRRQDPPTEVEKLIKDGDNMEVDQPVVAESSNTIVPTGIDCLDPPEPMSAQEVLNDTVMKDAHLDEQQANTAKGNSISEQRHQENEVSTALSSTQHEPQESMHPSAPPWPSQPSHSTAVTEESTDHPPKHPEMHLQMPPPPTNPFAGPSSAISTGGTPNSITGSVSQSPMSTSGSAIFSPAVSAAVAPSPARKKLSLISLSDYTKRKAKDKEPESKSERESSPASTASGPVVPPLQASSSDYKSAEHAVTVASEEDVKMEDVGDAPTTTTSST